MKLYYSPAACSLSVDIALREAGIEFEPIMVNLKTHTLQTGEDYYKISPRGYVPTLQLDDGSYHTEAASLLQYIGDLVPQKNLIPPVRTTARLKVTEWLTFISSELHKTLGWLWHEIHESTVEKINQKLKVRFEELEQVFSKNSYLTGDTFTVADVYCFTILNWTQIMHMNMEPYPNICAFMKRVAARPHVLEALTAEGLKSKW